MKLWHKLFIPALLLFLLVGVTFWARQQITSAGTRHPSQVEIQSTFANPCIWLCPEQIRSISPQGKAWDNIVRWADSRLSPNLNGKTNDGDLVALANAIIYVQTGEKARREKAIDYVTRAVGTEGSNAHPLSRNLPGYLIAADLVDYRDGSYKTWVAEILDKKIGGNGGRSVMEKALNRPNNHGTMALAAWASIAIYTENQSDLDRVAQIFKGWMGDRDSYADFTYGSLEWQDDPNNPVGINCKGCPRDGAQPEEMRRGGAAQQYSWEALQGAFLTAEILHLHGYDTYNWVDQALLRAVQWNYHQGWSATGDDEWQPWIINARYGTDYPTKSPARAGKNFGFTDFFYADISEFGGAFTPTPTEEPDPTDIPTSTPEPIEPTSTATPTYTPTLRPDFGFVTALVETDPLPNNGDAADDPAIWVHPTDRSLSTIIGTDKQGGLAVYDLNGNELQYLPDGRMNNVDLRYHFPLGDQSVALVATGNRTDNTLVFYKVNPNTRLLENVSARQIRSSLNDTYGLCMYHSPLSGTYYVIVNDKQGQVEQWEVYDNGSNQVDALLVRTFSVGSTTEGCVADDELAYLYIGEESIGIWKYTVEPDVDLERTLVDGTGSDGYLTAPIEGLTLYYAQNGNGYLIASSQGDNTYIIYERGANNAYVMTLAIQGGEGVDGAEETDGIDVTNLALEPTFPQGLFIAHDGINDNGNQNYKLVPWQAIANSTNQTLLIDPDYERIPTPTSTPISTATSTLMPIPTSTHTPTPISTSVPTATSTPTSEPISTETSTLTPTSTHTVRPTLTSTQIPTATPTSTSVIAVTPTLTPTSISTDTPTPTLMPTDLPIPTPTSEQNRTQGTLSELWLVAPDTIFVDQNFEVSVEAYVYGTQIDGAAAYVNFDINDLEVVRVTSGNTFGTVIQNIYDNELGIINFAAGVMNGRETGQFTLARITFKALREVRDSQLVLNRTSPRLSDLAWQGNSVLEQWRNDEIEIVYDNTTTLKGRIKLEGRPERPNDQWIIPLHIDLFAHSENSLVEKFNAVTDDRGRFEVKGLPRGEYRIAIKGEHTLQRVVPVQFSTKEEEVEFDKLLEGDAIDDNMVNLLDFSRLASGYATCFDGKGFVENADFNEDDCVELGDFSLLSKNFGQVGEAVEVVQVRAASARSEFGVITDKKAGQRFSLTLNVDTSTDTEVDAAAIYLNFNPGDLRVAEVIPGNELAIVLENSVDPQTGQLNYAAGILGASKPLPLELLVIEFEALTDIQSSPLTLSTSGTRTTALAYQGQLMSANVSSEEGAIVREIEGPSQFKIYLPITIR